MCAIELVRLLVVDDDHLDFEILSRYLETVHATNYEVTHAATVGEARATIDDNKFDAALIDHRLSDEQNGLDLIAEFGGREAPFPIILLTGIEERFLDTKAILTGAYDYIDKSTLTAELVDRAIRFSISSYSHERQLRETIAEATEQANINRRILSIVSHEMKSPICSLIGYSDHLINTCSTEATSDAAKKMKAASIHLQDFLQNLSEFVRLDGNAAKLCDSTFDLLPLLNETVDLFQPYARHKDIMLLSTIDIGPEERFSGDRLRIRQVMINLLKNAVNYSDEGVIKVSARMDGEVLKVRIQDHGVGMNEEKVSEIMSEIVSRQQLGASLEGGLGIGLSISRQLLRLMHGSLMIESTPGFGTTAGFNVPLQRVSDAKAA